MENKNKPKKAFFSLPYLEIGALLDTKGSCKLSRKQLKIINKMENLSAIYVDAEAKSILFMEANGDKLIIKE